MKREIWYGLRSLPFAALIHTRSRRTPTSWI